MIASRQERLIHQMSMTPRVMWAVVCLAYAMWGDLRLAQARDVREQLFGVLILTVGVVSAWRVITGFAVTVLADGQAVRVRQMWSTRTLPVRSIREFGTKVTTIGDTSRSSLVVHFRDGSRRRFRDIGVGVPEWSESGSALTPVIRELNELVAARPVSPHSAATTETVVTVQPKQPRSGRPVSLARHVESAATDWMLAAVVAVLAAGATAWLGASVMRWLGLPDAAKLGLAVPVFLVSMFAAMRVSRVRMNRMLRVAFPALNATAAHGRVHAVMTLLPAEGARWVWVGQPVVLTVADGRVRLEGADTEAWPAHRVSIEARHRPGRRSGINLSTPDGTRLVSFAPAGDPVAGLRYVLDARLSPTIRRALEYWEQDDGVR